MRPMRAHVIYTGRCGQLKKKKMGLFDRLFKKKKTGNSLDKDLIVSISSDRIDEAIQIIEMGASPNSVYKNSLPAICIASSRQQIKVIKKLIESGADVNINAYSKKEKIFNSNALNFSSANGNFEITHALILAGADINSQDDTGLSPLMSASYMGNSKIVKLLIENDVTVDLKDKQGYTALMFASNSGSNDVVKVLLENGANVNCMDNMNSTPIMFAAQHGFDEIVKTLLKAGADKNIKGTHGLNAIGFAEQNSLEKTIKILNENN